MKGLFRVALMAGLVAVSASSVQATEIGPDDERYDTDIHVVNNHLTVVRVYAEDANGRLHNLGRVARGQLRSFDVPADVAGAEFRIKVYPAPPAGTPASEDYGIKTHPLDSVTDSQVRIWLEADLAESLVEIERG